MTHLLHLVRSDLRRFRVLLAIWVLVVVCETIFRGLRPVLAGDPRPDMALELLGTVFMVTRWLGMIVIGALVVQTHPLVGSDAFWMTRPIRWQSLLASKLVLLWTTFVALPAIAEVVLMLACKVPLREVVLVALQVLLYQTLWVSLLVALSSLTRNLARLALVAGSLLVGLILLLNIVIAILMRNMAEGPQMSEVAGRAASSPAGFIVLLLATTAAAFALITVQYRTRSIRTSVAAGVLGVGAAFAAAAFWPSPVRPLPVPDWAARESAVQLTAVSSRGEFSPHYAGFSSNPSDGWQTGSARATLRGLETGWSGNARLSDASIQFPDGTRLATAGNGFSATLTLVSNDTDPLNAVAREVLGVSRLLDMPSAPPGGAPLPAIILTQAEYRKYLGARGAYRGGFVVDLDRAVVTAVLPLQVGSVFRGDRYRLSIDQILPQAQALTIRVRQFTSRSIFEPDAGSRMALYLRNRGSSEAVMGSSHGAFGMSSGFAMPFVMGMSGFSAEPGSGFSVRTDFIRFPAGYGFYGRNEPVEISPAWLSQAELVIVHTIPAGSVTRTLEIDGFEIAPAPPQPAAVSGFSRSF
jgi:hypothetical protein